MQIVVNEVTVSKVPGKKYSQIDVSYKNDKGELKGRKVMSFGVKNGLDVLLNAKEGDTLDVTLEKDGQYWNWVGVAPGDANAPKPAKTGYSVPSRDFESKEERAARQILIVRQSCLSTAVALYATGKVTPSVEAVIGVAKQLEEFVFGKGAAPSGAEPTVN